LSVIGLFQTRSAQPVNKLDIRVTADRKNTEHNRDEAALFESL